MGGVACFKPLQTLHFYHSSSSIFLIPPLCHLSGHLEQFNSYKFLALGHLQNIYYPQLLAVPQSNIHYVLYVLASIILN